MVGGFLHLEVKGDAHGGVNGFHLDKYKRLKFFAKASIEAFRINEINLFTGNHYVQYLASSNSAILLDTKWTEYTVDLQTLDLAPWERRYRGNLVPKTDETNSTRLDDVTSLGFDVKTSRKPLIGKIWLDYLRLIDQDDNEIVLTDADSLTVDFQHTKAIWISGARQYRQ